jgi:cyclic beta-1,2-glucan synthetase
VQVQPTTANRSIFTRIYSGDTTLDLYTRAVSDVYQDLFGEGNYVGKGIYDVDAFARSLHDRVPDNTLLSHDLFEGVHGRCGLVTNVVLFEDYPLHYLTLIHRMHRWARGDWQLLPWLGLRIPHRANGNIPNDLSLLGRWKIFDNLRRSLVGPAVLVFLICGWLLPGSDVLWTVLALSPYAVGIVTSLLSSLRRRQPGVTASSAARPLWQAALRAFFEVAFLPHESLITLDAIATTLIRLSITHKRLLQWVTFAHTLHVFGKELKIRVAWREMVFEPLFAILMCLVMWLWHPPALLLVLPLATTWIVSPYIAAYISRPLRQKSERLTPAQVHTLHLLARSTWLYFEHFVDPDDHWLPPDHFQEEPRGQVAHRTSPTNIGLLLLATLSAYDLGYIGPQEVILRIRNTLDEMGKLQRQRGHFLNWYDTRTLAPLLPRYISTVDSGNLAASLVVLHQSYEDIAARPILCWQGLVDTLDVLAHTLEQMSYSIAAGKLKTAILNLRNQAKLLNTPQGIARQLNTLLFENRQEMEKLLVQLVESSKKGLTRLR